MKLYAQINKIDEEQRMVWGYATTEAIDSQGETVTKDAIKNAWSDYMQFANVREMHQPSAVGIVKEYNFDDKGVMIGAKVVDDIAWEKVKEQVYKGFSIGGKKLANGYDAATKTITGMKLTEISLVDRPANPEALITVFKLDEGAEMQENEKTTDALLDLIGKGAIDNAKLLEIAQGLEKGYTVTVQIDNRDANDQGAVDPDKGVGGNTASNTVALPGTSATEGNAISGGQGQSAEKDPQDPSNASNTLNKPNNPGLTVKQEDPEIVKAFQALKNQGEDVAKGMYSIGELASLISALKWLSTDLAYERAAEGDQSRVPEQIAASVQALGQALIALATEEVGELVADLPSTLDPLAALDALIANSEAAPELKKWNEVADILKEGKRNNAADQDRVQKAHGLLVELGAACPVVEKHDHAADIQKADEALEKLSTELNTVQGNLLKANQEIDVLKAQIAAQPTAPKGKLHVIEKGGEEMVEVDPVLKDDGTVDDLATAIKKVHAGGGRLALGQR